MTRVELATLALCAYPAEIRASRGEEMLGTVLDASGGSRLRFLREIADLAGQGMRARVTDTSGAPAARLVADGLSLGAVLILTLDLSTLLSQLVRGRGPDPLLAVVPLVLLAVILATALVGFDQIAGASALIWTVSRLPEVHRHHPGVSGLIPAAVPILCFVVLLVAPRRRPVDPRRLGWLAVPVLLVAAFGPPSGMLIPLVVLGAILAVGFAAVTFPADPRLAVACAAPATYLGLQIVGKADAPLVIVVTFLAATPVTVALTYLRGRGRRRPTPANRRRATI